MTAYSASVLNSVAGHVQQVVLAAILQQEANRDYVPDALATDFTTNSVNWQLVVNTENTTTEFDRYGYLSISVTLPLINDSPLLNRENLYQRVGTINSTDVSELSLARESTYESVGTLAPDPSNPNGVIGGTYPSSANDTLERRLAWLLSTLMAKYFYVKRWNNWAARFKAYTQLTDFPDYFFQLPDANTLTSFQQWKLNGASRRLMEMGELPIEQIGAGDGDYEIALQELIQAADSLEYQFTKDVDSSVQFENFGASGDGGDITSAAGEESFYDPANESSTNLQNFLSQPPPPSLNSAADGAAGNESPSTSLKDC